MNTLCCPGGQEAGLTLETALRSARWRYVLAVGTTESAALFSAFAWQLYGGHEGWEAFDNSSLVLFHVLSLCITLWLGPQPLERESAHKWMAYLWFRLALVAVDVLVLARLGRVAARTDAAQAVWRVVLVTVLTSASVLRLGLLLALLRRQWPRWEQRALATSAERQALTPEPRKTTQGFSWLV